MFVEDHIYIYLIRRILCWLDRAKLARVRSAGTAVSGGAWSGTRFSS